MKIRLVHVVMELTITDFDGSTLGWLEELKDKAIEQSEVTSFKITNLPSELDLK